MSMFSNDNVDKASKWTVFVLVDLKVVFIITFLYVSVVNLISTTANSEASNDVKSNNTFTVTSKHTNVNVTFIDDAVLWNCRDHSVTKHYYRNLYLMLIICLGIALATFTIVKLAILYGATHGHIYLWRIAIAEHIEKNRRSKPDLDEVTKEAAIYRELLENDCKIEIPKKYNCCRLFTLFINPIILLVGLFLSLTTYDLHPLSCLSESRDDYIEYTKTIASGKAGTVEIQFPKAIKIYRYTAVALLFLFGIFYLINILYFYGSNFKMIKHYENKVKAEVDNKKVNFKSFKEPRHEKKVQSKVDTIESVTVKGPEEPEEDNEFTSTI